MNRAILTQYVPCTSTKAAMIRATAFPKIKIDVDVDTDISSKQNHIKAAAILCHFMDWSDDYTLVSGEHELGYFHVLVEKRKKKKPDL